jgi:hypothetical protein
LSFGPQRDRGIGWPRIGRPGRIVTLALVVLLASLGAVTFLALRVTHQDDTIHGLRAELRSAGHGTPVTAAGAALPVDSASAWFTLPDAGGGSLSVVAAAVRPRPGSTALTWLFVSGRHADPGARYGLLEGTCGGQFVTASDLADGTADRTGNLTIVAPNLPISSQASDVWILVYRWEDGVTLGGIQGPLIGAGARTFRTTPPC